MSNDRGYQLQKAIGLSRAMGLTEPVTLQPQYNLLSREIEWELVPACANEGLGILPWSPLGGGWLTGKYRRDERPTGATRLGEDPERGVEAYDRRNTERTWRILDPVQEIADERGVSMAQVALNWLVCQSTVSSVILGAWTGSVHRTCPTTPTGCRRGNTPTGWHRSHRPPLGHGRPQREGAGS